MPVAQVAHCGGGVQHVQSIASRRAAVLTCGPKVSRAGMDQDTRLLKIAYPWTSGSARRHINIRGVMVSDPCYNDNDRRRFTVHGRDWNVRAE